MHVHDALSLLLMQGEHTTLKHVEQWNESSQARSTDLEALCSAYAEYIHETDETEATSPHLRGNNHMMLIKGKQESN